MKAPSGRSHPHGEGIDRDKNLVAFDLGPNVDILRQANIIENDLKIGSRLTENGISIMFGTPVDIETESGHRSDFQNLMTTS